MSETDISTAAVERLLDGVTPGPWRDFGGENGAISSECGLPVSFYASRANRRFIAASRDLVPALLADRDRLAAEVARLTEARVVLITSDRGVCIGGRWDGWLMVRHPDGHWVSHHKLETVDPATEMTDLLRAAHAARREGEG